MPASERLIKVMKKTAEKSRPKSNNTDIVYGEVTKTSPLTVLVDNRFSLTSEFLILSPLCYATSFSVDIPNHKHSVDGKTSSGSGSCRLNVSLWGNLQKGDRLVMLRVKEGQAYLVMYRDKLSIKASCQDL